MAIRASAITSLMIVFALSTWICPQVSAQAHAVPISPKDIGAAIWKLTAKPKAGNPPVIVVTLKNISKATTADYMDDIGRHPRKFKIEVRNERGELTPLTSYGKEEMTPEDVDNKSPLFKGLVISENITFNLKPGATLITEIPITRLYDMSLPGNYSVTFYTNAANIFIEKPAPGSLLKGLPKALPNPYEYPPDARSNTLHVKVWLTSITPLID